MQHEDDRILPATRWVVGFVTPILIAAAAILYVAPGATERLWAWPMAPEMTSLAVGGGYLAGAVLFARALRAERWHEIGLVFPVASLLTALLLVATLLHWEAFNHRHVSFWTWLVVYVATPVLLPSIWWANRDRDPGVPVSGTPIVPRWVRTIVGTVGAGQLVLALVFFAVPSVMIEVWPWDLSALTARTLGAFLAFIGAMLATCWVEARWSALRLHVESATIGLALVGLGALRAIPDFGSAVAPRTTFVVLLGLALVGLLGLQFGMRRLTVSETA